MKTRTVILHSLLLVGLAMTALTWPGYAQMRLTLVEPESRLWIEGSSTVNEFTCEAGEVEGQGRLRSDAGFRPASDAEAEVVVTVPVEEFDCGKNQMNNDLYKALKAEEHPTIRYELEEAELAAQQDSLAGAAAVYELRVAGRLTIAGTERVIDVDATGVRLKDGRYRVAGYVPLKMTDFGVKPPSALLGLIKAHDDIVVWFDLVAAPATGVTVGYSSGRPEESLSPKETSPEIR